MGKYLKTEDVIQGKADYLVEKHEATVIERPDSFESAPEGKALVAVVSNPDFDAAAWCYDDIEFGRMTSPRDIRTVVWLAMDIEKVKDLL